MDQQPSPTKTTSTVVARTFALIGPGRLGLHLARQLVAADWQCVAVRGRRPSGSHQQQLLPPSVAWDTWNEPATWPLPAVLLLCVPDRSIEPVAREAAACWQLPGAVVLHTSGCLTAEALTSCARAGAATASWHPLQSFPPVTAGAVTWAGVPCAIEGEATAVTTGFAIARELGLRPWLIRPEQKALYHAAAALASNLSHILVVAAKRLMAACGAPGEQTGDLLRPLVLQSVGAALDAHDLEALTGPIARGDQATIERHLQVLPAAAARIYRAGQELASTTPGDDQRPGRTAGSSGSGVNH